MMDMSKKIYDSFSDCCSSDSDSLKEDSSIKMSICITPPSSVLKTCAYSKRVRYAQPYYSKKSICSLTKSIRRKIASLNGIEYNTSKCLIEGKCHESCSIIHEEGVELFRKLFELEESGKQIKINVWDLARLDAIASTWYNKTEDDLLAERDIDFDKEVK